MEHLMLDIETLGTDPGAAIMSIAAVAFDPDTIGGVRTILNVHLDVANQALEGAEVSADTIAFWRESSARHAFCMERNRVNCVRPDIRSTLVEVNKAIGDSRFDLLWAQAYGFDYTLLRALMRMYEIRPAWDHWRERDTRSLYTAVAFATELSSAELKIQFPRHPDHQEHTALGDAIYQAGLVQQCARLLRGARS